MILLWVVLTVALLAVFGFVFNAYLASTGYRGLVSDHFDGTHFFSYGKPTSRALLPENKNTSVWKWMFNRPKSDWKWRPNTHHPDIAERVSGTELVITYINHASVLIQTEGLNIITDPIWAKRASPFSFMGPKRYRPAGIAFDKLPPIDVVLLSHNHYDHLHLATLRRLVRRHNSRIYTSLGNTAYLASKGIKNAVDMDWWQELELDGGMKITAVPAQHFSARALTDRNKTLWCGFVLHTALGPVYFAGDTGYGPFVSKIAERFSGFRFAMIPIGAYLPEWFMHPVHVSPDEALQMHRELNVTTSMAIHFGTFHLADDGQDEASTHLIASREALPVPQPDFRVIVNGESITIV